jgi:hypothetical protein
VGNRYGCARKVCSLHGVQQLVVQGENAPCVLEGNLSRFGQSQTAPAFTEDGYAEMILQPLHLQTDGRRSAAETRRCLSEAAEVLSDGERSQRIQVQVESCCHCDPCELCELRERANH